MRIRYIACRCVCLRLAAAAFIAAVCVGIFGTGEASAIVETFDYKITAAVDSLKTHKSDWLKERSNYNTGISNGEGKWAVSNCKVRFTGEAGAGDFNKIMYYGKNLTPTEWSDALARTQWNTGVPGSGSIASKEDGDPPIRNWTYANIYFNTARCNNANTDYIARINAHEIGHALGLAHNTNGTGDKEKGQKNHIMYFETPSVVTSASTGAPHTEELASINKRYFPSGGWLKTSTGTWRHFNSTGYPDTGWKKIDGYWHHFTTNGDMQIGWQKIPHPDGNSYWYWFGTSVNDGKMRTEWQKILQTDGKYYWYWFGPSANDGKMRTSWQKILQSDGKYYWYYFGTGSIEGRMQIGWQHRWQSDGNYYWYYFGASENDGQMKRGWQTIGGWLFYFGPGENDGRMRTGWQKPASSWYYMRTALNVPGTGPWGAALRNGTWTIGNKAYRFDADGVCLNR